jgi:hypothetical protein
MTTFSTSNPEQQQFVKAAKAAYEKLRLNRSYASTEESDTWLGALLKAHVQSGQSINGDSFGNVLSRLFRQKPGAPKRLPQLWKNPLSGEPLFNPWAKDTRDLKAQTLLTRRDPELATLLEKLATDPCQVVLD